MSTTSNPFLIVKPFNVEESLEQFSLVALSKVSPETLVKASSTDVDKLAFGVVLDDLTTIYPVYNHPVRILTYGVVENPLWNWNPALGTELYCGPTGQIPPLQLCGRRKVGLSRIHVHDARMMLR